MAYTKNVSDFSNSLSVPINHEHRDSTVISHPSLDIFLPVVLYGCETWSLTLREERRLRVFEESIWTYKGRGDRGMEKAA